MALPPDFWDEQGFEPPPLTPDDIVESIRILRDMFPDPNPPVQISSSFDPMTYMPPATIQTIEDRTATELSMRMPMTLLFESVEIHWDVVDSLLGLKVT